MYDCPATACAYIHGKRLKPLGQKIQMQLNNLSDHIYPNTPP